MIHTSAYSIAYRALRQCLTSVGFVAGSHHFVDLWARDSLFATFGANASGLTHGTKKTLRTFFTYQRADGLIPYLILRSKHTIGKYYERHSYYSKPVAVFRSHMSFGIVPDGGLMTIIAMRLYVEKTKDTVFLKRYYASLVRAYSWYEHRYKKGLVREWFQCEWADALLKVGNTLYTNVLYFKAARDMAWLSFMMNKQSEEAHYVACAKCIQKCMRDTFWAGSYFADWKDWKRQDYFATHPNMLAIIFGLANRAQAKAIFSFAKKNAWNGWTLSNSFPAYPTWRVSIVHLLIGLKEYHNGFIWLQPGILYAVAQYVSGKRNDAKKTLARIGEKIVEWNGAYEVYERNGDPVFRRIYRAEQPFAWSAGLFVWASAMMK